MRGNQQRAWVTVKKEVGIAEEKTNRSEIGQNCHVPRACADFRAVSSSDTRERRLEPSGERGTLTGTRTVGGGFCRWQEQRVNLVDKREVSNYNGKLVY